MNTQDSFKIAVISIIRPKWYTTIKQRHSTDNVKVCKSVEKFNFKQSANNDITRVNLKNA